MKASRTTAEKNVLRDENTPDPKGLPEVHGYDFNRGVDYSKILASMGTTGFQATHFAEAVRIINAMIRERCTIYLGYTSNLVSSGLRDVFRYLVQHKMVDVVVTTAGGIEEDIIKCLKPFYIGSFEASGKELREQGINRAGNVFIPNSRYSLFEDFLLPLLAELDAEQKKSGKIISSGEFVHRLGKKINHSDSIYYWAYKNNIPVFCPAITDGSIGDMMYFFSYEHPEFRVDQVQDIRRIHDITMDAKKTGVILLGGGAMKHYILNSNMMRNGANYSVYVNTAQEYDGSDSGARPDEAVSWGKLSPEAMSVKLVADATLVFPFLVAQTFAQRPPQK